MENDQKIHTQAKKINPSAGQSVEKSPEFLTEHIPERATAVDPEPKPPEAHTEAVDGAGSSSEADPAERGGGSATSLSRMPGDTGTLGRAEEAGGSPAFDTWEHVSQPVDRVLKHIARGHRQRAVTLRREAIRLLERSGHGRYPAEHIADTLLKAIAEPDSEMIEAGAAELEHALLPEQATARYRKELAAVVWRAMFARVRT